MVCHENYPVGHWQEIQIWNHSFFLTFFSHAHQNITFQSPWKLGRIRILSYRFPQQQHHSQICWIRVLVKIVALFTSKRDCKYIIYEFEYLDPGTVTRRVFNGFWKSLYPRRFEHVLLLDCKTTLAYLNFHAWLLHKITFWLTWKTFWIVVFLKCQLHELSHFYNLVV